MSKKVLYGLLKAAARGEKPSRYLKRYSWWKRVVPEGLIPILQLCILALVLVGAGEILNWVNAI